MRVRLVRGLVFPGFQRGPFWPHHRDRPLEGRHGTPDRVRQMKEEIQVMTAQGLHLFPFRTEKLNLVTPMVLRKRESR